MKHIIGRTTPIKIMDDLIAKKRSSFVAITGRRRVGKTYLVDQVYGPRFCFSMTGIQDGDQTTQISNFVQKLKEYSQLPIVTPPNNWQEVFQLFKIYLQSLPKTKKHVIFLDELPWIVTAKSGFIQLLAHLWNDYLSKQNHFILVICGSSTSWITQKIINDKGGLHNRIDQNIKVEPFTLEETKLFLEYQKIQLSNMAIAELYMAIGGIPYYLEQIKRGESPTVAIDRICFAQDGRLRNEYDNLYKALFDNSQNHEAIVKALASSKSGLNRQELIKKSKIKAGGPYTRTMEDLILSGFIVEENPYGKKKQGSIYRLVDEYSVFYHKFISKNKKAGKGIWQQLASSQAYKILKGYAFETLCQKHIAQIKQALGISGVYTETSSFRSTSADSDGFQIDLIIDRKDSAINLCECKYIAAGFKVTKAYASSDDIF